MLSQYCSDEVHGLPRHRNRRTVRAIPTSHGPRECSGSRVAIPRASRELPLIPSLLPPAALGLGVLARATAAGRNIIQSLIHLDTARATLSLHRRRGSTRHSLECPGSPLFLPNNFSPRRPESSQASRRCYDNGSLNSLRQGAFAADRLSSLPIACGDTETRHFRHQPCLPRC